MKQIIKINEIQLRQLVNECVKKIINEQFEKIKGNFAVITYLPLIDEYRVEWYDYYYENTLTMKKQTPGVRNSVETKRFSTEEEAEQYCDENGLEIIERNSLRKIVFPDVKSIRSNTHPFH